MRPTYVALRITDSRAHRPHCSGRKEADSLLKVTVRGRRTAQNTARLMDALVHRFSDLLHRIILFLLIKTVSIHCTALVSRF